MKLFIIIIFLTDCILFSESKDFRYPDRDKNEEFPKWGGVCDSGDKQSPIDLVKQLIILDGPKLKFKGYENDFVGASFVNSGHSVQITVNENQNYFLYGGGLETAYKLKQIHWHWNSEHTIDGQRYPLEAHFVHSQNLEELDDIKPLLVLGVLYHNSKAKNKIITQLQEVIPNIKDTPSQPIKLTAAISPSKLLPKNIDSYFRYEGSLTTPNCSENVDWIIFKNTVPINHEQIETFQNIKDADENYIKYNYRDIQPSNYRSIAFMTKNFKTYNYMKVCMPKRKNMKKEDDEYYNNQFLGTRSQEEIVLNNIL